MKKVLLTLSLILLLLYGAWHVLAWVGTQRNMNELAGQWRGHGELRWEGIRPGLSGQVRVHQLSWHWFDTTEPVSVASLVLEVPGPLDLLRGLWLGEWPDTLSIKLSSLEMQLQPDLFRPWARARPSRLMGRVPLALYACGERRVLSPTDFLRMGIDRVALDLSVTHRRQEEGMGLTLNLDAGDLGRVRGKLALSRNDLVEWILPKGKAPLPEGADLRLHDGGFMRRLASYCAAHEDKTLERWQALASQRWRQAMTEAGLVPSDSLTAFYGRWITQGGELRVQWRPDLQWEPKPSQNVSAEEWLQAQGLSLHHNGQEVARPAVALIRRDETEPEPEPSSRELALERLARFHVSEIERAAAWIDRRVRVTLHSGRTLQGRLLSRDEQSLHIHQLIEGGEVIQPVAVENIETFEVWRRGDDPGRPLPPVGEPLPGPQLAPWLERIEPIPSPREQ